jgi:hypothetical protein
MEQRYSKLITLFYNPNAQTIWSRGRFVPVQEFVRSLPKEQADLIPSEQDSSVKDPEDVDPEDGPVIKCINGMEHICYQTVCYRTGRSC